MLYPAYILAALMASVPALSLSTTTGGGEEVATKYPNQSEITQVFNFLDQGYFTAFFSRVAPDVNWTLMGTHPLAGVYNNLTIFAVDTLERLENTMDPTQPTTLKLVQVIGGGDSEWSVQELHGLGVCKNGE
jgi:uncharacterized protein